MRRQTPRPEILPVAILDGCHLAEWAWGLELRWGNPARANEAFQSPKGSEKLSESPPSLIQMDTGAVHWLGFILP